MATPGAAALGAGRAVVTWMMLREVCVLAAIGLGIGVPTALAGSRLLESFLFGTTPNDPRTVAAAAAKGLPAILQQIPAQEVQKSQAQGDREWSIVVAIGAP